jgi:hypothetical protein
MDISTWGDTLNTTFSDVTPSILTFGLHLLAAIIIFVAGWIVANFICDLIKKLFESIKVDSALRQAGLEEVLKKGDIKLNSGAFVGGIVKWFIVAIFFLSAVKIFGLSQITDYLDNVIVNYIPHVIVTILILLVSVIIGEAAQKIVVAAASNAHLTSARLLGKLTKWAIVIFAILNALVELNIAAALIQTAFIGVVVALSLAFGLAFGLGGRDVAARLLQKGMDDLAKK